MAVPSTWGHRSQGWPAGSTAVQWSLGGHLAEKARPWLAPDKPGEGLGARSGSRMPSPGSAGQDAAFSSRRALSAGREAQAYCSRDASSVGRGPGPPGLQDTRGARGRAARLCLPCGLLLACAVDPREPWTSCARAWEQTLVASHALSLTPPNQPQAWACTFHLPTEVPGHSCSGQ